MTAVFESLTYQGTMHVCRVFPYLFPTSLSGLRKSGQLPFSSLYIEPLSLCLRAFFNARIKSPYKDVYVAGRQEWFTDPHNSQRNIRRNFDVGKKNPGSAPESNVKLLKAFKRSHGKLTAVFDVSSLFYDLQDVPGRIVELPLRRSSKFSKLAVNLCAHSFEQPWIRHWYTCKSHTFSVHVGYQTNHIW